jgi:fumarylacetoacetase
MTYRIGETHDSKLMSWVDSANDLQAGFPIQNLPFGVIRPGHIGVAIGDQILDLQRCWRGGLLSALPLETARACSSKSLNRLLELTPARWSELRLWLSRALRTDSTDWKENRSRLSEFLVPMREAEMLLPAEIGDYTDFYASIDHATNVGRLFRPDHPLLPNYKYVPIAYHGRASSIVISGTPINRPLGQSKAAVANAPVFGPSQSLDYEMEVGFFIGGENALGESVPIQSAEWRIFGLCLLNDWSARDIQSWEYQPLGPFLSKSFATSISPWVVTLEALTPFRTAAYRRASFDPLPLPHLESKEGAEYGAIDMNLEVLIRSKQMRTRALAPARLSRTNAQHLYWTMAQMVTHHTSNGCNLRPGDLLGSGTVSGPGEDARGCLLELTRNGAEPVPLPDGERRSFLEDGDEIILRGYCERESFAKIGFGECRGTISPASYAPPVGGAFAIESR